MSQSIHGRAKELLGEGERVKEAEKNYRTVGALGADMTHGPDTLKWLSDICVFANDLPDDYPLKREIKNEYHLHKRKAYIVSNMIAYLRTIVDDDSLGGFDDSIKERRTIMTAKEHEYLDMIEARFANSNQAQFSLEDEQRMQDVFSLLEERRVLKNMHVDNTCIYYKVGDFGVFREWLADQEQADNNIAASITNPSRKEYDVFISHASDDKRGYVNALHKAVRKLGIKIFYDSEEIDWGDDWKRKIIESTDRSEFAIIVISENFFDREWTEKELGEFLRRQNDNGQKIILPLLLNVSIERFKEKYPAIENIQAISSKDYTKDKIAILLAKELIKRYK